MYTNFTPLVITKSTYYLHETQFLRLIDQISCCKLVPYRGALRNNLATRENRGKRNPPPPPVHSGLTSFYCVCFQALNSKRQRGIVARLCSCFSRSSGNYLGVGYLLTKLAYLINVTLQFLFMTIFLGRSTQFESFGLSVTKFISEGMVWEDSSRLANKKITRISYKQNENHVNSLRGVLGFV